MKIKKLVEKCHNAARNKGFYICSSCNGIDGGCPDCSYTGQQESRNIPELLMLIVSELGEAVEALRKDRHSNWEEFFSIAPYRMDLDEKEVFEECIKDTFEDEIADAIIRLFDLCGYLNIDIERNIKYKMQYNETRPVKHGKKF